MLRAISIFLSLSRSFFICRVNEAFLARARIRAITRDRGADKRGSGRGEGGEEGDLCNNSTCSFFLIYDSIDEFRQSLQLDTSERYNCVNRMNEKGEDMA